MRKKKAGPISYDEWDAALKLPFTFENARWLGGGKLKQKNMSRTLTKRISDYVTDNFNMGMGVVKECEYADIKYALRKFGSEFKRLYFFENLDFFDCAEPLRKELKRAIYELTDLLEGKFGTTDADIVYELNDLRRTSERRFQ